MSSRRLAALAAGVVLVAVPLRAQSARPLALGLALDAETVPDAFSSRCGRANTGSVGWGANVFAVVRPRRALVLQGIVHVVANALDMGCTADLPIVQVGPHEFESRPGVEYPRGTPRSPLATTAIRVGAEVPNGALLARLSVGGGAVWGDRPLPLGVAALTLGSRGVGTRWFAELEYAVSTTAVTETRNRYSDEIGRPASTYTAGLRRNPRWSTLRAGVEVPLRRR